MHSGLASHPYLYKEVNLRYLSVVSVLVKPVPHWGGNTKKKKHPKPLDVGLAKFCLTSLLQENFYFQFHQDSHFGLR